MSAVSIMYSGVIILSFASTCAASTVCEQNFQYQYGDGVKAVSSDAFAISDGCSGSSLHKLPKAFVAIRMSVTSSVPVVQEAPEPAAIQHVMKPEIPKLIGAIHFSIDSAVLNTSEKRVLEKLIRGIPADAELTVTGYTCTLGSDTHNLKLSARRANAVANYLKNMRMRVVRVEGRGECCPASKVKKLNRRVEIIKGGD